MDAIDPAEILDQRVADLDDKLSGLLAEMEATAIEWAATVLRSVETPQVTEEP
ncbi:hypothetical protein SSPO_027030 [Streptomyces antimycoticus]|uniref:Uncharacterized protein n=1 Tax=Streptomyces antimycoticus TaxID=68175 RepID=A0A499UEQ7_9ACTN|nr:hypothetical protein [Streptomyces antimycoticus]BBJ39985.1 hypothetical protein SSPO_027030 [Streptomyces antimycoticus]